MSTLRDLTAEIIRDGTDRAIDADDWGRIRALLPADGGPTPDQLLDLLDLRSQAHTACPEFDDYFFPALKAHILADGQVSPTEHYRLLRLLYGGGRIDAAERRFLQELRAELRNPGPEFEAMYQQVMRD